MHLSGQAKTAGYSKLICACTIQQANPDLLLVLHRLRSTNYIPRKLLSIHGCCLEKGWLLTDSWFLNTELSQSTEHPSRWRHAWSFIQCHMGLKPSGKNSDLDPAVWACWKAWDILVWNLSKCQMDRYVTVTVSKSSQLPNWKTLLTSHFLLSEYWTSEPTTSDTKH